MSWPNDADGDVFRKLEAQKFDFDRTYTVDFNVDFEVWPPAPSALELLRSIFSVVKEYPPQAGYNGYVLVRIDHKLEYQFVMDTQRRLSELTRAFGGNCDAWGVLGP